MTDKNVPDENEVLEVLPVDEEEARRYLSTDETDEDDFSPENGGDGDDDNGDDQEDDSEEKAAAKSAGLKLLGIFAILVLIYFFVYLPRVQPTLVVLGSSMEPTFRGPTLQLRCPDCRRPVTVSVEAASVPELATFRKIGCPWCGFAEVPVTKDALRTGDALRPNWSRRARKPQRFDTVVFDWPEGEPGAEMKKGNFFHRPGSKKGNFSTKKAVYGLKRVVGLPGETVEIRRGNLIIDGKWTPNPSVSIPLPLVVAERKGDRIEFTHSIPVPFQADEKQHNRGWRPHRTVLPIVNQPENPRFERIAQQNLENVRDFTLSFRWEPEQITEKANRRLEILANQGDRLWLFVLDWSANKIKIYQKENDNRSGGHNGALSTLSAADFAEPPTAEGEFLARMGETAASGATNPVRLVVRLVLTAQTATVFVDSDHPSRSRTEISADAAQDWNDWEKGENRPISTPFTILLPQGTPARPQNQGENRENPAEITLREALGVTGSGVSRAPHYSESQKGRIFTVPTGEYLLLGDNSAVSIDARQWKKPTVLAESIRAKVEP